jgi:hypothetical protein
MLNPVTTVNSKICFGYTNKASGGFFLPFFDYDTKDISLILSELIDIQIKYKLSSIYIYNSINGYNALSLDKLPYNILVSLYKDCKNICDDYRRLGLNRNFLTLRIGKDKLLYSVLESYHKNYEKSLSHAILLNVFFNTDINIFDDKKFDLNTTIVLKAYRSEKHGFLTVKKL